MHTWLRRLVYTVAFAHIALIVACISRQADSWLNNRYWANPLGCLCSLNYSAWRYGFFAPDVGKSTEVQFDLYDSDGARTRFSTLNGFQFFLANHESVNRLYCFKVHAAGDTTLLDLCARSAATRMFNLFPGTERVDFTMRSIRYPTMAGFLRNEPAKINEFYTTEFDLQ